MRLWVQFIAPKKRDDILFFDISELSASPLLSFGAIHE
jgi:hypothetical protein